MKTIYFLIFICVSYHNSFCQIWHPVTDNPTELGTVNWIRNFEEAAVKSRSENKPIFILFQEVPGCTTCQQYGQKVLRHPLVVEAIETNFIPLCIYNNKGGHDAEMLQRFKEPSWNNPVVRIVNSTGKDLTRRVNKSYDIASLTRAMMEVIEGKREEVPAYLKILHEEHAAQQKEETYLAMYCFWTGEKAMAQIPGVLSSEAGFMNGKEVVKVTYNGAIMDESDLAAKAKQYNCADMVFTEKRKAGSIPTSLPGSYRKDSESKYYLYHSSYRFLPMTPLQALKVNYELSKNGNPDIFLSERQRSLYRKYKGEKQSVNAIGNPISESWYNLIKL